MKNGRLILAFLAGCALVLSSLACGQSTSYSEALKPDASNIYMATDETGNIKTTTYSKTDDFFVFYDASAIETGAQFQARWYALDVPGRDPNNPFKTIDYSYDEEKEGLSNIYIQLTSDTAWPAGRYRVEIYMDSVKMGEQQFKVE